MSHTLPHLHRSWQVDQTFIPEEDHMVVIRFCNDWDPVCMKTDKILYSILRRNKHIMIVLGTGNKINWVMEDKQEMVDIRETVDCRALNGGNLVMPSKTTPQSTDTEVPSGCVDKCCGGLFMWKPFQLFQAFGKVHEAPGLEDF
ncbi:Thioredoxin-like protein 4A [Plecturocebus cupreus]